MFNPNNSFKRLFISIPRTQRIEQVSGKVRILHHKQDSDTPDKAFCVFFTSSNVLLVYEAE